YWVYGGQQESGSVGIVSRGNDGQITFREWHPVGAEEYGYIAPDPLHPTIVYGGRVTRFDWSTGQVQDVSPEPVRAGRYRWVRTMPLLFSPLDPHVLYFGANVLFQTSDGGHGWRTISPDLTRTTYAVPENVGAFASLDPEKGKHRGVIYTVAPSPRKAGLLWVGTDDGLIHVTHNAGRTWTDVTPAALTPWSKVSLLEASRFDTLVAYAAVNRFRLGDLRPHVYRTGDGDRSGTVVRRFSSADTVPPRDSGLNIPDWWMRPSPILGTGAGMHRFVWDLHYPPPAALRHEYPIAAVYHDTPREPRGPWVLPGR